MKCTSGKLSFDTERLAWLKIIDLEKQNKHMGDVYKCECQKWHMTSYDSAPPAWVTREIVKFRNHKLLMKRQKQEAGKRKMLKDNAGDSARDKAKHLCRNNAEKIAMVGEMNKNIKRSLWRRLKMRLL